MKNEIKHAYVTNRRVEDEYERKTVPRYIIPGLGIPAIIK